jgi:D-lactate dehydrogenase (cytochrome)
MLTATLRLAPLLPTTVAVVQFPDVVLATEAVREMINSGASIRMSFLIS